MERTALYRIPSTQGDGAGIAACADYFLDPARGLFSLVCRALRLLRLGLLMRKVPLP